MEAEALRQSCRIPRILPISAVKLEIAEFFLSSRLCFDLERHNVFLCPGL